MVMGLNLVVADDGFLVAMHRPDNLPAGSSPKVLEKNSIIATRNTSLQRDPIVCPAPELSVRRDCGTILRPQWFASHSDVRFNLSADLLQHEAKRKRALGMLYTSCRP